MAAFVTNLPKLDLTRSSPVNLSGMNVIKLLKCNLDAGCAKSLAKSLLENRSLSYVCLDSNPLTDMGVEHISQAITKKLSLQTLQLNDVGMTLNGMLSLATTIAT